MSSLQCGFQSREQAKKYGDWSSVVALFFAEKSLIKTDRCAGALSWRRKHLLALHFSGRFLRTIPLKRRKTSTYRNFPHSQVPLNDASEFRKSLESDTYQWKYLLRRFFHKSVSDILMNLRKVIYYYALEGCKWACRQHFIQQFGSSGDSTVFHSWSSGFKYLQEHRVIWPKFVAVFQIEEANRRIVPRTWPPLHSPK